MSYKKSTHPIGVTVYVSCDARKGKGICGNSAEITVGDEITASEFLYSLGWGLLRGNQICGSCNKLGSKRIHFPRKKSKESA